MIFETKFDCDKEYNGKECVIIAINTFGANKDIHYYTIKFEDGHVIENVYDNELK